MTFADIIPGSVVFLDANMLVHAVTGNAKYGVACEQLLDQVEQQQLQGYTSADVLGAAVHRLMTLEAIDRFGWPIQGIATRLRRHPVDVQQLALPRRAVDEFLAARIAILPVTAHEV